MGAITRTTVPLALECGRSFLHWHMDAKRGCGVVNDTTHHVSADGEFGRSSHDVACVFSHSSRRRACRHDGPPASASTYTRLDGGRVGVARRLYFTRPRHAVDFARFYFSVGTGRSDERSGMAGYYAGGGFGGKSCPSGRTQFGGF